MLDSCIRIRLATVARLGIARTRARSTTKRLPDDGDHDSWQFLSSDGRRDDGFRGGEHFSCPRRRIRDLEIQRFSRRTCRRQGDRETQPLARIIRRFFEVTHGFDRKIGILNRDRIKNGVCRAVVVDTKCTHSFRARRNGIEGQTRRICTGIRRSTIVQHAKAQLGHASAASSTTASAAATKAALVANASVAAKAPMSAVGAHAAITARTARRCRLERAACCTSDEESACRQNHT